VFDSLYIFPLLQLFLMLSQSLSLSSWASLAFVAHVFLQYISIQLFPTLHQPFLSSSSQLAWSGASVVVAGGAFVVVVGADPQIFHASTLSAGAAIFLALCERQNVPLDRTQFPLGTFAFATYSWQFSKLHSISAFGVPAQQTSLLHPRAGHVLPVASNTGLVPGRQS
jgi:hypothetical protein